MLENAVETAVSLATKANALVPNSCKIGVACAMLGASIGFAVSEQRKLRELKRDVDLAKRALLVASSGIEKGEEQ